MIQFCHYCFVVVSNDGDFLCLFPRWIFISLLVVVILGKQERNIYAYKGEIPCLPTPFWTWILNLKSRVDNFFFLFFLLLYSFFSFIQLFHTFKINFNRHRHTRKSAFHYLKLSCQVCVERHRPRLQTDGTFARQFEADEKNRSLERDLCIPLEAPLQRLSGCRTGDKSQSAAVVLLPTIYPPPTHRLSLDAGKHGGGGCSRQVRVQGGFFPSADVECCDRAIVSVPFKREAGAAKASLLGKTIVKKKKKKTRAEQSPGWNIEITSRSFCQMTRTVFKVLQRSP